VANILPSAFGIKTILARLPNEQQTTGASTPGTARLERNIIAGIGMTIVIDRLRGEEDKDIVIVIARDIDHRIIATVEATVAVAAHVERNLDSAQRAGRL
jgi:hypothetical protein